MHTAITASQTLPLEYRKQSKAWLDARGLHSLDVRVLELDATGKTGSWRIPTAEQLEVGIVAETRAEYDQLKAGDQI